ncbi:MAG TPA: LysM peptidoglycan-binding domain-containing protein [Puia sp.]|uniref:LysM peptidoglycan-binding domain-containing protein n=1 Tax=Puia sp. TaxID=2045100 RepID=UPI002B81AA07|nr:LysM peptidoglycan-binding domain-containing protein [Puia sp.]HVU93919.1 LysM peptidoglycan-binding domain-containing protein [Puia sp.]
MRSPVTVLFLISFLFIQFAHAQTPSNQLTVFGQTGKLYLEHTVVAKENWYSVGRLYNVSPKELAPFNHLALTQPLAIGQVLQIPLTHVNFAQDGKKTPAETLIPVYHTTQEKEWMYRISVNHNRVPIATLEKWNNVNKDAVRPGMHLIVGYLRVKTALSALATDPAATPATAETKTVETKPAEARQASPASTTADIAKPISTKTPDSPIAKPISTHTSPETTRTVTQSPSAPPSPHFDGGIFKSEFLDNGKNSTGVAGIFKSTSGWQDGKYYALMNNVAIGTIVKVTETAGGKSVFVKVLGQLPDMKESVGLTIRISNAAAAEMSQTAERFNVQVSY